MKRSVAVLILALVTIGVIASSPSSALAVRCAVAVETGYYSDNACVNEEGFLQYVKVLLAGTKTADGFECAVVVEAKTAVYSDANCTNKGGILQYVKVTRPGGPLLNCSVEPCRYTVKADGTGKTAHQVIAVTNSAAESVPVTCSQLTGEATEGVETVSAMTLKSLSYSGCTIAGLEAKAKTNGCDYLLSSSGSITIQGCSEGKKRIEFEIASTGCVVAIGPQGPLSGIGFHNIGEKGKTTAEITVETKVSKIAATIEGSKEKCSIDPSKTPISAEYTTGNLVATAETDPSGTMANAWWE